MLNFLFSWYKVFVCFSKQLPTNDFAPERQETFSKFAYEMFQYFEMNWNHKSSLIFPLHLNLFLKNAIDY